MVSGFFLGGMAPGITQGANAISNDMKLQSLMQLQVAQQQSNQKHSEFMKLRSDAVSHLDETMTQLRIAHPDWTDNQLASNPAVVAMKDMIGGFDKNLKLPNTIDSIVAGLAARPSQAVTEGALARAKEGPQHQALVQSEINKNNALSGIDVNNPDRPGTGANGAALGGRQAGQPTSFNQRFAQEGQTDAPKVMTWPEARATVSQKYGPEVTAKAELWLKGNTSVVTGLRGSGMGQRNERAQIQNAAMDLARSVGMDADQINQNFVQFAGKKSAATAQGRTAGTREANLGIILTAADSAIDAAVTASQNVPRSDFTPLNSGVQWAQAKFSNPQLKIFQQKNLQLAELWAKSFNPTGTMRVEDRNLALDVLNTAIGNGTYEAAAHAIRGSIGLEKNAAIKFLSERGYGPPAEDQPSGSGEWTVKKIGE